MSIIASIITFVFIAYITSGKKAGGVMSGIDRNIPQSVSSIIDICYNNWNRLFYLLYVVG